MDNDPKNSISALYVHVPFCARKCDYCDFYSISAPPETHKRYINALSMELRLNANRLKLPLETIFVGGGTPTCLSESSLASLLEMLGGMADENTEFSIEANPSTITPEIVHILKDSPVSRVNLGVQSFNDEELKILGRIHNSKTAFKAWDLLRGAGLDNLGLDLIYAVVNQTIDSWNKSLAAAIKLSPRHLSCYALTVEQDTPIYDKINSGFFDQPEESIQREMYYSSVGRLADAGLEHYEISNFAAEGFTCKHNITYWKNGEYLGLGPAAASHYNNTRQTNSPDLGKYIDSLADEKRLPAREIETLSRDTQIAETVMMGLRLTGGVERKTFKNRFKSDIIDTFGDVIEKYVNQNALCLTDTHLRVRQWALFTANTILADFMQ